MSDEAVREALARAELAALHSVEYCNSPDAELPPQEPDVRVVIAAIRRLCAELQAAKRERDAFMTIINGDGSLVTMEEHLDIARDMRLAYEHVAEIETLEAERDAAASMLLSVQQDCVALRTALADAIDGLDRVREATEKHRGAGIEAVIRRRIDELRAVLKGSK